jgi:hypothetical protein
VTFVARASVSIIGFTKTTPEGFFERLLKSGVRKVVDVRLQNTSQLVGSPAAPARDEREDDEDIQRRDAS